MPTNQDPLIPTQQVKKRFGGVSDMWLHRCLHDGSGFPRPVYIGRIRFWRLSELVAWEEQLPRASSKLRDPNISIRASHD